MRSPRGPAIGRYEPDAAVSSGQRPALPGHQQHPGPVGLQAPDRRHQPAVTGHHSGSPVIGHQISRAATRTRRTRRGAGRGSPGAGGRSGQQEGQARPGRGSQDQVRAPGPLRYHADDRQQPTAPRQAEHVRGTRTGEPGSQPGAGPRRQAENVQRTEHEPAVRPGLADPARVEQRARYTGEPADVSSANWEHVPDHRGSSSHHVGIDHDGVDAVQPAQRAVVHGHRAAPGQQAP